MRPREILTKSCSCKIVKGITNIRGHYHDEGLHFEWLFALLSLVFLFASTFKSNKY